VQGKWGLFVRKVRGGGRRAKLILQFLTEGFILFSGCGGFGGFLTTVSCGVFAAALFSTIWSAKAKLRLRLNASGDFSGFFFDSGGWALLSWAYGRIYSLQLPLEQFFKTWCGD